MSFSTNFSTKAALLLFTFLICLSGCASPTDPAIPLINDSAAIEKKLRIAVLPLSNLSSSPAPLKDIRQLLIESFETQGLDILDEEVLGKFIVKHRIRYVGGITRMTAQDFRWETGADAVLITSLELYSEVSPPKIALTSRLVSTGNDPTILWMDGIGLAGDDSMGILELFLIENPQKLVRKAVRHLSTSLAEYFSGQRYRTGGQRAIIKFWPNVFYRSPIFEPGMKYTVAVIPFFNLSQRNSAGEIMSLHFVKQLTAHDNFTVIEPGIVRHALLKYRIIMDDGISFAQTDLLASKLNVDLILTGKIFDYQDYQGFAGTAKVDFSALLIEKKSREVVWMSESHNDGDDGVFFFDWGQINTAHAMASEMVLTTVETLVE
jgi:TolB-like protein